MRVLAAALLSALALPALAGDKDAVVDVKQVMESSDRLKDFLTEMEKDHKEKKAEIQKLEKELETTKAMLEDKTMGPKLRDRMEAEYAGLAAKYEHMVKRWNESAARRVKEAEGALYKEMQDVIAAYAKENGLEIVFEKGQNQGVVWAATGKEITGDVAKRMNEKYAKEKEAKSKEPAKDGEPPKDK